MVNFNSDFTKYYESEVTKHKDLTEKGTVDPKRRGELNKLIEGNLGTLKKLNEADYKGRNYKLLFDKEGSIKIDQSYRITRLVMKPLYSQQQDLKNITFFAKYLKTYYEETPVKNKEQVLELLDEAAKGVQDLKETYKDNPDRLAELAKIDKIFKKSEICVEENAENKLKEGYIANSIQAKKEHGDEPGKIFHDIYESMIDFLPTSLQSDSEKIKELFQLLKGLDKPDRERLYADLSIARYDAQKAGKIEDFEQKISEITEKLQNISSKGLKHAERIRLMKGTLLNNYPEIFSNTIKQITIDKENKDKIEQERSEQAKVSTIRSKKIWSAFQNLLGAGVFVAIGTQVPAVAVPILHGYAADFGKIGATNLMDAYFQVNRELDPGLIQDLKVFEEQIKKDPMGLKQVIEENFNKRAKEGKAAREGVQPVLNLIDYLSEQLKAKMKAEQGEGKEEKAIEESADVAKEAEEGEGNEVKETLETEANSEES